MKRGGPWQSGCIWRPKNDTPPSYLAFSLLLSTPPLPHFSVSISSLYPSLPFPVFPFPHPSYQIPMPPASSLLLLLVFLSPLSSMLSCYLPYHPSLPPAGDDRLKQVVINPVCFSLGFAQAEWQKWSPGERKDSQHWRTGEERQRGGTEKGSK